MKKKKVHKCLGLILSTGGLETSKWAKLSFGHKIYNPDTFGHHKRSEKDKAEEER